MKEQVILDFFDFEKPCPETVELCEQLRIKYKDEVDRLTKTGCSACKKNTVKAQFIKKIWESHLLATLKK